jgi:hypothetical protein
MEQSDILSARVRWLAIATGFASALALFPILALFYPALLIVGGIIQPRSPSAGRWLVWAGAAELWAIFITYDIYVLFPHPFTPFYMGLTFLISNVLLLWYSAELIADGLNRLRARRSSARAQPAPVGWAAWIVAAVLNFLVVWCVYGIISWHRQPGDLRVPDTALHTPWMPLLATAVIAIALDISLTRNAIELRRARERGTSRTSK